MTMEPIRAILPVPTKDSAAFWAACDAGRLALPRCTACGHVFYYPRQMCPRCGGRELGEVDSAGRGTVFSFTHVAVSFYGASWDDQLPYTVILVDLDEGPRMLSRLIGDSAGLRVGDRVRLNLVTVEGHKLPYFERDGT